jgi:hypothetical protein
MIKKTTLDNRIGRYFGIFLNKIVLLPLRISFAASPSANKEWQMLINE